MDYITKPFQAEEVLIRVATHLTNHRLTQEILDKNRELKAINAQLRAEIERREEAESSLELVDAQLGLITKQEMARWGLESFVGESAAMRDVIGEIRKLQPVDNTSVLIRGESGTGKELVARALHFSGRRNGQPFIVVNCAAVPSDLAESLFFGHVKGAFSGAHGNRRGYFEMADGGTLFLDEIGDMPLPLQAKLLRAFQDGSFQPVGGSSVKKADVRILSATNVDLKARIGTGEFRNDLYFRLAGYEIELKPLRERSEDVSLFITHFLTQFAGELKRTAPQLSDGARQALMAYHYPGNIRELKSIVERALIESGGEPIEAHHLHLLNEKALTTPETRSTVEGEGEWDLPWNLDLVEAELVKRALKKCAGNVSHSAELLGIHRSKIYRILAQDD